MGLDSAIRTLLALLILGMVVSGCAGTARGIKSSVYEHDEAATLKDVSRSPADAMVVIRATDEKGRIIQLPARFRLPKGKRYAWSPKRVRLSSAATAPPMARSHRNRRSRSLEPVWNDTAA